MATAFITPVPVRVREAASAGGHWITLHAAESDEGTVHVFIGGNGRVTKGPSSLVGSAIGHLASHPSVKGAEHHPPGHEPPGARSHPQYAEHQPPPKPAPLPGKPYARLSGAPQTRQEQPKEGPEPLTKEQTHAGLATAREQAKSESDEDKTARLTSAMKEHDTRATLARFTDPSKVAHHEAEQRRARMELDAHRAALEKASQPKPAPKPVPAKPVKAAQADEGSVDHEAVHDFMAAGEGAPAEKWQEMRQRVRAAVKAGKPAMGVNVATLKEMQRRLESSQAKAAKAATPEAKAADAAVQSQQAQFLDAWRAEIKTWQQEADKLRQEAADYRAQGLDTAAGVKDAGARYWDSQIEAIRERALGKPYTPDLGRQAAGDPTHPWVTPQRKPAQDQAADAAVQSQQAQADLAAYRASKDRNPNPWAPHLSPPVGDAKDKELAEKATRAQLAHQSVQAQQQQAAATQQQEGQRAHDKEMVRLKAEVAPTQAAIKPLEAKPAAAAGKPGEITKEHIQAKVAAGEHLTREEKGFVLNGYRMPKPKPEEPTDERRRTVRESAGPAPRFVVPILTAAR